MYVAAEIFQVGRWHEIVDRQKSRLNLAGYFGTTKQINMMCTYVPKNAWTSIFHFYFQFFFPSLRRMMSLSHANIQSPAFKWQFPWIMEHSIHILFFIQCFTAGSQLEMWNIKIGIQFIHSYIKHKYTHTRLRLASFVDHINMWIIQVNISAAVFFSFSLSVSWIFDLVFVWIQFMLYLLPSRVFSIDFSPWRKKKRKKNGFDIWFELRISTDLTNRPSCAGDSFCLLVLINSCEGNANRMWTERGEAEMEADREESIWTFDMNTLCAKLTQQLSDQ